MSVSGHKAPQNEAALEPYHDDPTMTSPQYDNDRSPALVQSPIAGADEAGPPLLSIRNAVPLLPTPGTLSSRHPTYVRYPLFSGCVPEVLIYPSLRRS